MDDECEQGVRELRRVARGPVVILTYDSTVSERMWLIVDYFPEVAALDRQTFPSLHQLTQWLGGAVSIEEIPLSRDCTDWMLGSFWAHPERVRDASARAGTSSFSRMPTQVVGRVVASIASDLGSGAWEKRYGHLRRLHELDVGLRLLVATTD